MAIEKSMNFGFARHPGKMLARELDARGMTHAELAIRAGTSEKNVSQIINGIAPISSDMAIKLEYVLGTPAYIWDQLQMNYQEALQRDKARELQAQEQEYARHFDYSKLRAIYPELPEARNVADKVEALRRMFAVSSLAVIFETASSKYLACARSSNAEAIGKVPDNYALVAWLRVGEIQAESIQCPRYDEKKLKKTLPEIKRIINEKDISSAWLSIRTVLLECGVKIVAVPYLAKTYVNGAVRWIGSNPVIIMSDRNAYADFFWFALLHEICHVLKHGKKYACVAFEESVRCFEKPVQELEADEFAAEFFISKNDLELFTHNKARPSDAEIREFAKKCLVPYYIVVGRLGHEHIISWSDPIASSRPKLKILTV